MKLTVRANAKLNLSLDIVGKKDDGYHLLETVMQSVSLFDSVTVKDDMSGGISVSSGDSEIPDGEDNIAYKAALEFFSATGIQNSGVDIRIKKRIPSGAGLAGGSADAAAVLVALNRIFSAKLDIDELCDIGERVGADVPFCLTGGTVLARGTGNILSPIPTLEDCFFVIAKPDNAVSTAEAFSLYDRFSGELERPDAVELCEHICGGDIEELANGCVNIFEQILELEESLKLKELILRERALGASLTGSGSAVFGIFEDEDEAESCADRLKRHCDSVFVAKPVPFGCEIED